jgi:hypothetical protein
MAAELKRTESFQYPNGHFGHLTDNQQALLEEFRAICQREGYYTPAGKEGRTHPTHDDELLL